MGRRDMNGSDTQTISINNFMGQNSATQFSQIQMNQSPSLVNLLPSKTGGLYNREGTVPLTETGAGIPLARIYPYRESFTDNIVSSGGAVLYKYNSGTFAWDAQTMTNPIATPNISAVQYRDDNAAEVLVIADGATLKEYNGTAVANITPAADDAGSLPVNGLANINTNNPAVGTTVHNNRVVIWPANKDIIFHSKPGFFDYFPVINFQRFVRDNDYIQNCISYGSALLVFMRKHVAVLFGDGYSATPQQSDWSQDFLDTTDGCVNGRSVRIVVFPDGSEQVFYQTDRGVSAVTNVDTQSLDNSARFATRDVTKNKIDWTALGVTNAEWAAANSYYYNGFYWLIYKKGAIFQGLVYNSNNDQWYPVDNVAATDMYGDVNYFYFVGTEGHLKVFDPALTFDYADKAKTIKTPVSWFWYSKLLNPVLTGFDHFWDILMIEAQQFAATSTITVEVNTYNNMRSLPKAIKTEIFVVGVSVIGQAQIANSNLTDIVNNAKRLRVFLKGQYAQIKLSSTFGEPVGLYDIRFEVRPQVTYSS